MAKRSRRKEKRYSLEALLKILTLWSRTGDPEERITEEATIRIEARGSEGVQIVVSWQSR